MLESNQLSHQWIKLTILFFFKPQIIELYSNDHFISKESHWLVAMLYRTHVYIDDLSSGRPIYSNVNIKRAAYTNILFNFLYS